MHEEQEDEGMICLAANLLVAGIILDQVIGRNELKHVTMATSFASRNCPTAGTYTGSYIKCQKSDATTSY